MNKIKKIVILFLFMAMGLMANAQYYIDVVYLNNGSIIKGQITELIPQESIRIETSDGIIFVFDINDVFKCEKEPLDFPSENLTESPNDENQSLYPQKGYRGFVDLGYMLNGERGNCFAISISHGYQINPELYLGAGIIQEIELDNDDSYIGLFADVSYNLQRQKNSMFINMRVGPYFYDGTKLLFNANIGYRLKKINLSIGYELAPYEYYFGNWNFETQYTSSLVLKIGYDWGSRKLNSNQN